MDSDEQALALIGTIVADKYRVLDVLGAGGMGTVYLAEHVFTKRRVALKRMHPQLGQSKLAAERFIRESQAPSTIGHPGIVQVLDGGSQPDGSLYIVHELLEGISMSEAVARGSLTPGAVIQLGIELLHALAAAHAKGIIHRDIKPDNVFIAQDGSGGVCVKLLDFGIASLRDSSDRDKLTRPGSVLGTAQYMSPEQALAAPVDERSDLWSVGALLYHALSGQLPYPGDTFSAVIYALASKRHVPLAVHRPDLPKALVEVVERALRKPSAERFASAKEMAAALAAVSFESQGQAAIRDDAAKTRVDSAGSRRMASSQDRAHERARDVVEVRAAAGVSDAAGAVTPRPVARSVPSAARAQSSAPVLVSVVAGTMVLCTLTWMMVRQRGADARVASGQLSAAPSQSDVPSAGSADAIGPPSMAAAVRQQPMAAASQSPPQGLPVSALAPVLRGRQAELDRCLQEATVLQLQAGAARVDSYRLDVSLSVAASGQVERAELSGAAPAELLNCLRAQLLVARFPVAAATTEFQYPLLLTPTVVGQ